MYSIQDNLGFLFHSSKIRLEITSVFLQLFLDFLFFHSLHHLLIIATIKTFPSCKLFILSNPHLALISFFRRPISKISFWCLPTTWLLLYYHIYWNAISCYNVLGSLRNNFQISAQIFHYCLYPSRSSPCCQSGSNLYMHPCHHQCFVPPDLETFLFSNEATCVTTNYPISPKLAPSPLFSSALKSTSLPALQSSGYRALIKSVFNVG